MTGLLKKTIQYTLHILVKAKNLIVLNLHILSQLHILLMRNSNVYLICKIVCVYVCMSVCVCFNELKYIQLFPHWFSKLQRIGFVVFHMQFTYFG